MHPPLPSLESLLFFIMTLILILTPQSAFSIDKRYLNCNKTFDCGWLKDYLGYPFWGADRPQYCGHPRFKLHCVGNLTAEITIKSVNCELFGIDIESRVLQLRRKDYIENLCPTYLMNTTLDYDVFQLSSESNALWVYYNCPTLTNETLLGVSSRFTCNINQTTLYGYYLTRSLDFFPSSSALTVATINASLSYCSSKVLLYGLDIQYVEANPTSELLSEVLVNGFDANWFADRLCDSCIHSGGQCESNPDPANFTCYWPEKPYPTSFPTAAGSLMWKHLSIGVELPATAIIAVSLIMLLFRLKTESLSSVKLLKFFRLGKMKEYESVEAFIVELGSVAPKRYSYSEIKKLTNSFTEKLGQGGYGSVYKGKLSDGRVVAVKVLSESKGDGQEFINEVASISRTSHVNIVTLIGFCHERSRRALIYEFMPNGSLDKFIYHQGSIERSHQLEIKTLFEIVVGITRGLEYLHRGCNTRILHFDIKPHNILLDESFCPKISDFGIAKLCKTKESIVSMTGAKGTVGYIAPEVFCRNFGGVSYKSDVYSYGMMVLDTVGGRKNSVEVCRTSDTFFPSWIYEQLEKEEKLSLHRVVGEGDEEMAREILIVSLWCIQTNPSDRPSMTKVLEMLHGSLEALPVPPKPFLSSPVRSPQNSHTKSSNC